MNTYAEPSDPLGAPDKLISKVARQIISRVLKGESAWIGHTAFDYTGLQAAAC